MVASPRALPPWVPMTGYYGRTLVTRVGKLELRVPQDRAGRFSTELFERYQRSERALVAALAEMYVQGVSTRKVKAITEELCGHSFSASSISAMNQRLDDSLGNCGFESLLRDQLAEFERDLIRARTGEGRARAVASGQKMGRPPKLTPHQQKEAIKRRDQDDETLADIGRSYNVSPATIHD
jgi:hypothetical protein